MAVGKWEWAVFVGVSKQGVMVLESESWYLGGNLIAGS